MKINFSVAFWRYLFFDFRGFGNTSVGFHISSKRSFCKNLVLFSMHLVNGGYLPTQLFNITEILSVFSLW